MAKPFKERTLLPYLVLLVTLEVGVILAAIMAVVATRWLGGRVTDGGWLLIALMALFAAPMLWLLGVQPLRTSSLADRTRDEQREGRLIAEADRQQFGARLARAMEMAQSETAAVAAVGRALGHALPGQPAELLLADSSRAHLAHAAVTGPEGRGPGCQVESPWDCPAVRRGQTTVFTDDRDLDACPQLEGREYGSCSAVCVPVTIMGQPMGVLHGLGPAGTPPEREEISRLEAIASQAGSRISLLRAMARTQLQASTDPLTGLLNRRSFENLARELLQDPSAVVVAMADLDHFKLLNDTYGHETGDRALRLFSRILRASLRPNDLACRYGGEEFVLLLPDCTLPEGIKALERLQEQLALSLTGGETPPFTASFGVAAATGDDTLEGVIRAADMALLTAKISGRNRVVMASERAI